MTTEPGIVIEPTDSGVCIQWAEQNISYEHSFFSGELARRARQSNQAILKACSNRRKTINSVLDLTGGWGQDSLILASHGKQVTLLEQNATVFGVVEKSLQAVARHDPDHPLLSQLTIFNTRADIFLQSTEATAFDCIYLDPMFPAHKSGAKPSKSLQLLQQITDNESIERSFDLALQKAANRVVVKRPLKAPNLVSQQPDQVLKEKTIRFDIYLTGTGA